jgi:hypothetical protein
MDDTLTQFASNLIGRLHGPFSFRFVLQPTMAMIYAALDGFADAREGKPAYFWSILSEPKPRWDRLREGWSRVARVILLGVVMDVIYQLIVFKSIHPLELVVIVLALAFVPYLLLRGPINRLASYWIRSKAHI